MPDVSRRGFLRATSYGAAAIGLISALPVIAAHAESNTAPGNPVAPVPVPPTTPAAAASATGTGTVPTLTSGAPFMLYITDAASGTGTVFIGEQTIPFNNPQVVQALQQALA